MNTSILPENGVQSPLLIEISNLKAALERYQTAADTTHLHLQRQALDSSTLTARCTALEQDNTLLQAEIQVLRSIPESNPSIPGNQVSELSLALRHVQDQYRLSEEELKNVHEKLGLALKAKARAMYEMEGMEELVKGTRGREERLKAKIRQLEGAVQRCEEEKKMVEMCVKEYADLVRGLEGRSSVSASTATNTAAAATGTNGLVPSEESVHSMESSTSGSSGVEHSQTPSIQSPPQSPSPLQSQSYSVGHSHNGSIILSRNNNTTTRPIDSLQEGRMGLQRLLGEFHEQTGKLEEEIARLHGELEMMEMKLEQREKLELENEREIGRLKGELTAAARADKSASMMVEKYMRFSQQSTNLLQTALQTQKQRHAATVSTLTSQITNLTRTIERERSVSDKLRETLDELTLEISRESFGRRREVSLRLALMERERKVGRMIEWWIGTIERGKDSMGGDAGRAKAVDRSKAVLSLMRGIPPGLEVTDGEDEERMQKVILDCQELEMELEQEMEKRMELERRLAKMVGRESIEQASRTVSLDGDELEEPTAIEVSEPDGLEQEEEETLSSNEDGASPIQHTASLPAPSNQTATLNEQPLPEADAPSSVQDPATDGASITESEPGKYADIINDLHGTANRYDSIQSSFTDCHNALSDLRSSLNSMTGEVSANGVVGSYLVAAVQRLDDYCEDARVELEILIADEARISQGYETLLSLSSGNLESPRTNFHEDELLKKIDRFVNGTEPSMERARVVFGEKVDNLMHDIPIVKKEMHDRINPSSTEDSASTRESLDAFPIQSEGDEHDSRGDLKATSTRNGSGIWKTLTSSMLSPATLTPRSPSPNPRPVPTFGSLMTSGRPRYPPTHDRSSPSDSNPLNRLGLRIAMPNRSSQGTANLNIHSPFPFTMNSPDYQPPGSSGGGGEVQPNSAPLSRVGSGWFGTGGMVRARTMSSIHVPGFGVGVGMTPVTPKGVSQLVRPVSRSGSEVGVMVHMDTTQPSSAEGGIVKDQEEVE